MVVCFRADDGVNIYKVVSVSRDFGSPNVSRVRNVCLTPGSRVRVLAPTLPVSPSFFSVHNLGAGTKHRREAMFPNITGCTPPRYQEPEERKDNSGHISRIETTMILRLLKNSPHNFFTHIYLFCQNLQGDRMSHRGWSLNALQHPPCLHLCVTMCHAGKAGLFLADLLASTLEAAAAAGEVKVFRYCCARRPAVRRPPSGRLAFTGKRQLQSVRRTSATTYSIRVCLGWSVLP